MSNTTPILEKIKQLREFTVDVDIPEGFDFSGVMPFNATISGNKGTFKVLATSFEEAEKNIQNYISKNI